MANYPELLAEPRAIHHAGMVAGAADVPVADLRRPLDDGPKPHSPTGPSSANRVFNCPGSVRLIAAILAAAASLGTPVGTVEASPESRRGDRLHALAATGETPADLSPEDADALALVREQIAIVRAETPGAIELVEERLDLAGCGAGWGWVDMARVVPGGRAVVLDWKFGDRAVKHPRHNWQMILYAWGLWAAFGCQEVEAIIVRPAAEEHWRVMRFTFTADLLETLGHHYRRAVFQAESKDAPLRPGDHCTFCAAKQTCPARWAALATVPRHQSFEGALLAASPVERARMLESAKLAAQQIHAFIAAIEDLAVREVITLHGYEVAQSKGRRCWKDPAAAEASIAALLKSKGLSPDRAAVREVISPAQAEDILGKSKAIIEALTPHQTTAPGKRTLTKKDAP